MLQKRSFKNQKVLLTLILRVYVLICISKSTIALKTSHLLHIVEKGDNLSKISKKYQISVSKIQKINYLTNKDYIYIGQKLRIPHKRKKSTNFSLPKQYKEILKYYQPKGDNQILGIVYSLPSNKVYPSASGQVIEIGFLRGYGKYIIIDHGKGWLTMYSLLKDTYINQDDYVTKNTQLGTTKNEKIFFSLSHRGKPVNPVLHLEQKQHLIG